MNTVPASEKRPLQLQWNGANVVVTPEDQDRFVMEAKKAVASCQGMQLFERYFKQFKEEFLVRLHAWCDENKGAVFQCFVPFPVGGNVNVYVIGSSPSFDFDLSDKISDLEQELDSVGWRADIVQLPTSTPEMLGSFFNPAESFQVYGNIGGT